MNLNATRFLSHLKRHKGLYTVLGVVLVSVLIAELTGLRRQFNRGMMLDFFEAHHVLGWLLYIAAFTVGNFIHISGLVFLSAAGA